MSATALYKALLKANVPEDTAEQAVEGLAFADNVATKTELVELDGKLKNEIARLELKLFKGAITLVGIIIAAVGLMLKFL